ncbi:hypothetical protein C8R47DRAFT_1170370 [Mycena vitilis]|nr:hypothetical protein C8R47DRAFT_1170370 [Mycena vitilis]
MHNSAERPPDPACHPGTRESVLDTLRTWSQDDNSSASLMWLYGSAGMGKSAIAQTFAAERQEERTLGASFFFRRGDTGRGNWKGLFPTIAYQLAASYPELGHAVRQAVESDKLVSAQAMRHHFQKLIVEPLEQSPQLTLLPIVVVDGLDECEDRGSQIMLLNLIMEGLRTNVFPVRVLLTSRPEAHLRDVLEAPANSDVCQHLELCADTSAYDDIRRYLCNEFSRVRNCLLGRGVTLENGWPSKDAINHLVRKSSGTFIYATTVVKYVDDEYSHPRERLDSVLALDPQSTAPLDTLYTQILSNVPNRSLLLRVLQVVLGKQFTLWDPEVIDAVLNLPAGTSRLVLRGLHSLLYVPAVRLLGCEDRAEEHKVKLLHASLGDFLRDPMRSVGFFVDTSGLDVTLMRTMIEFLSSSPINQDLFETVAAGLLMQICDEFPDSLAAADLLRILRNVDLQHVAYMSDCVYPGDTVDWLKKFHPLQSDLLQIWEDLQFVSDLDQHEEEDDVPSAEVDNSVRSIRDKHYAQLLTENPQVLSILGVVSLWSRMFIAPSPWREAMEFLNLKWNALRPLSALRVYSFRQGQPSKSLIDFVRDPRIAGNLYPDSQDTYQFVALHGISRIRQIFINDEARLRHQLYHLPKLHWKWLKFLLRCLPSDRVLRELENLDLTQSCPHLRMNKEFHRQFHYDVLRLNRQIVDWLWRFPTPPLLAIKFWEGQLATAEACHRSPAGSDFWLQFS